MASERRGMTRRGFLRRLVAWTGAAVVGGGLGYGSMWEPRQLRIRRLDVAIPGLATGLVGLRIAHLTDMHVGNQLGHDTWRLAFERARELDADIAVCTGDLLHAYHLGSAVEKAADALAGVKAPLGTYFALGNHENGSGEAAGLTTALRERGVKVLWNGNARISVNGADLWLAGVDDMVTGHPNLDEALEGLPDEATVIMLAHMPNYADRSAERGVALQLSGHSHGGQVRLPLIGAPYIPFGARRYPMGLYTVSGTQTQVYTGGGVGVAGPPFRINCPPEIAEITLRRA